MIPLSGSGGPGFDSPLSPRFAIFFAQVHGARRAGRRGARGDEGLHLRGQQPVSDSWHCDLALALRRFLALALYRANVTVVHHQAWMY